MAVPRFSPSLKHQIEVRAAPCGPRARSVRGISMPDHPEERWLTYREAGELLGISANAIRVRAQRARWPRRLPNMPGAPTLVRVPEDVLVRPGAPPVPRSGGERAGHAIADPNGDERAHEGAHVRVLEAAQAFAQGIALLGEQLARANHQIDVLEAQLAEASEKGSQTDPLPTIGIQTLSQTVEMLREDVAVANSSLRAERERAEHRIGELQTLLTEERRRIDGLHTDLADARTAAVISGSEAAALRAENALLKARPWWRRWFR